MPCAAWYPPNGAPDFSPLETPATPREFWALDPRITFLNHGSFGSCPPHVLQFQFEIRQKMEREPVDFFVRELEPMLDNARAELAQFLHGSTQDLVFVPNATAGINAVLRSLPFDAVDELLVTNHEYNACRNALDFIAARHNARVRVVEIPFPLSSEEEVVDRIAGAVSDRTRLLLIDHVTSQTGLILPIAKIVSRLADRRLEVLVDGAHAPGMIPLRLDELPVAYYAGNCHKWLCAPKGAGFLYVHPEHQNKIRPLSISHGSNSPRRDRSRFLIEFGWTGTWDPSAYLSVPAAIRTVGGSVTGGWHEIMARNHALALAARTLLCEALRQPSPSPDAMIGSLASIPLPPAPPGPVLSPLYSDPLQDELRNRFQIEVPIVPWPAPPQRLLRISAQLYNALPEYRQLSSALQSILPRI